MQKLITFRKLQGLCDLKYPTYFTCKEYETGCLKIKSLLDDKCCQKLCPIWRRLREALSTIAAQDSGEIGSTKLSDCMAAYAKAALGE